MGNQHVHCDSDPIECSVQAMEGELAEMRRQRDHYRDALARLAELGRRLFAAESDRVVTDRNDDLPSRALGAESDGPR